MDGTESNTEEIWKCTVNNKSLIPYWDKDIQVLSKPFFLILEAFQFEVFSFLVCTSDLKRGSFEEFKNIFEKYLDFFELGEERISRALDIALDSGLFKAKWTVSNGKFFREFSNDSEASEIFRNILRYYKNRKAQKGK